MEKVIKKAVIVADGVFPTHPEPLGYLESADVIVCCDGSTEGVVESGFIPDAIVGDMDSLSEELANSFADKIYVDDNQETNDLTKAVEWCHESGYDNIVIIGATGKREDHTIGNISLLADYSKYVNIIMVTDNGIFHPFHESCKIDTFPGQQVSIFSIDPETVITSNGLRYPLVNRKLNNWWQATLNEATDDTMELKFSGGPILVFLQFAL